MGSNVIAVPQCLEEKTGCTTNNVLPLSTFWLVDWEVEAEPEEDPALLRLG